MCGLLLEQHHLEQEYWHKVLTRVVYYLNNIAQSRNIGISVDTCGLLLEQHRSEQEYWHKVLTRVVYYLNNIAQSRNIGIKC